MTVKADMKGAVIHCSVCSLHPGPLSLKPAVVTLSVVHSVQAAYPKEAVSLDGQVEVRLIPYQWISRAEKKLLKWSVFRMEGE